VGAAAFVAALALDVDDGVSVPLVVAEGVGGTLCFEHAAMTNKKTDDPTAMDDLMNATY
jgi:hypothetical protein